MVTKKLMLPILAVIVGVAASAFTTLNKGAGKSNISETPYFWYQVKLSTNQTQGSVLNSSAVIKDNAKGTVTPCLDQTSTFCVVGFLSNSIPAGTPIPTPTSSDDNYINQSNP